MSPAERRSVESHLAECDECRALVSAVIKSSMVEPSPVRVSTPATAPTTPVYGLGKSLPDSHESAPIGAPVLPGDVLGGKYIVERVLGAGGMGVVVAARHAQLKQRVALKFLLPAACEAPGAKGRFLREGQAAARITSEHVARVTDTGVLDSGAPYLVMEYLEGQDLGALVSEGGPLAVGTAVDYVLQACEAIVEAHSLGIVHRDLKPSNLFLTRRSDGSPLVKVLDFGISKTEGGSSTHLTSTSTLMGSPRYMSPEQMVSAKDVDARTDIWALGIIAFELLSGEPVWKADTVQGLCALIATAPPPRLRDLAPSVPEALEQIIERCLAKSREERIQSVADLALALSIVAPPQTRLSIERILRVSGRGADAALPVQAAPRSMAPSEERTAPSKRATRRVLGVTLLVAVSAGLATAATLAVQRARLARSELSAATASSSAPSIPRTVESVSVPDAASIPAMALPSVPSAAPPKSPTLPRRRPSKPDAPPAVDLVDLPNPVIVAPPAASLNRALSDRK